VKWVILKIKKFNNSVLSPYCKIVTVKDGGLLGVKLPAKTKVLNGKAVWD